MADRYDRRSSMTTNTDDPPNSRLFIIGSKLLNEEDFRKNFEEFGHIEEIYVVKDRQTGENKGVTYIKYSKTSEAARALEAMNGKGLGRQNRHIRVMVAASRDQGSRRDSNEEEKILRLFVVVPKTMTDSELHDYFKTFGDIDYAAVMRDRETRESKGFAYVKYYKFSHAAKAFEECDKKYRAVFAEPKKSYKPDHYYNPTPPPPPPPHNFHHNNHPNPKPQMKPPVPFPPDSGNQSGDYTKLTALVSPQVNQDQLWKLFDIVPGLDYCDLRYEGHPSPNRGIASIVYNSCQAAAYAKRKLHGFEYPPGNRIIVKPDHEGFQDFDQKADLFHIAETLAQASNLLQVSGIGSDLLLPRLGGYGSKDDLDCSVKLPSPKPLVSQDLQTVARCFIVCQPNPLPNGLLKEVFCRFGDLIDVYLLNNRNCGYAKYASKESAEEAIKVLHGAEIHGVRIKVLKAEEKQDQNRKRQRVDEKM